MTAEKHRSLKSLRSEKGWVSRDGPNQFQELALAAFPS